MTDYIEELNESQREAVLYDDGPSLVVAGAGSGKTRVLTCKIAYLLEHGYAPWSILALTFTNKAAREMRERIRLRVGDDVARRLWMGTFHSVFARILRAEAAVIGFTPRFTIYDASDSRSLIKTIVHEMGLDEKTYKPAAVQSRISQAKNRLVSPEGYADDPEIRRDDAASGLGATRDIYRCYQERCRRSDAMDFDDLLVYTYRLFADHPDIRDRYAGRFRYVLVDEYQDTNYAQHRIVSQLASVHRRVCVVGDDAQSIYSFRGADIGNILGFTRLYPEARTFKLEQNYRSTQSIVHAANSLIEKNRGRIEKEVFSLGAKGEPLRVLKAYSDVEEAEIVADRILRLRARVPYKYGDFAVLYRTNAQSRVFEETFRRRGLPYRIYGGLSFYQRKEVKDIISYFRLAVNPHDEEAFRRVLNYPARGIGGTTQGKLAEAAARLGLSLWNVIGRPAECGAELNRGILGRLSTFRALIEDFAEAAAREDAYELGRRIVQQSGVMNDLRQGDDPESRSRRENAEELMNGLHDFCEARREEGEGTTLLADYLSEVSLLTDQDTTDETDTDRVTLMTIHSAKGLEFKNVFVAGMEENLFPGPQAAVSLRTLEEERRLFYVAITRAGEHCFLSYSRSRFRYGQMEFSNPSRFLHDIDARYLDTDDGQEAAGKEGRAAGREAARPRTAPTLRRLPERGASVRGTGQDRQPSLRPGQTIIHERFGIGEVVEVEGEGDDRRATVRFRSGGEKRLLLRFARFTLA